MDLFIRECNILNSNFNVPPHHQRTCNEQNYSAQLAKPDYKTSVLGSHARKRKKVYARAKRIIIEIHRLQISLESLYVYQRCSDRQIDAGNIWKPAALVPVIIISALQRCDDLGRVYVQLLQRERPPELRADHTSADAYIVPVQVIGSYVCGNRCLGRAEYAIDWLLCRTDCFSSFLLGIAGLWVY